MSALLHSLFVVLAISTAVITFVTVVVGDDGEEKAKDRLLTWWAWIGDHGLENLTRSTARLVDTFFSAILGSKVLTLRAFIVWWAVCATSVFPFVTYGFLSGAFVRPTPPPPPFNTGFGWMFVLMFGCLVVSIVSALGVAVFDFSFLVFSRLIIRKTITTPTFKKWLIVYFLNAYVSYIAVSLSGFLISNGFRFSLAANVAIAVTGWLSILVIDWGRPHLALGFFMLSWFTLSSSIIAPVMTVAILMQQFRKQTEPIAIWLLERTAGSKKGLFAGTVAFLTAITGLLSAFGVKGQ